MSALDSLLDSLPRIVFVAGKGGVGKTTFAVGLAANFARRGEKTLVVSTDPAAALGDVIGAPVGDEIVIANVDGEHGTMAEVSDPPLVPLVQRSPIIRSDVFFARPPARGDARGDHVERAMQIDQQPRRARRRRVQQLGVEAAIQRPFVGRHVSLLEQAAREDLGVLVPRAVEHPTAAEAAHAAHGRETRREKVKLEMHRVRVHLLFAGVEALEPRVVHVDALEGHLQTEPRRQRARERCLSCADHPRDAEKHSPTYSETAAGSNVETLRRHSTVSVPAA